MIPTDPMAAYIAGRISYSDMLRQLAYRPVTVADLNAAVAERKARRAKREALINHPDTPYVFAPRKMWRGKP